MTGDFRRALDDKSIDAIIVATPDHWHALATIWGCQAGKDVYVEKPVSHSPWEGRKMVEAARRHERIVQVGTQNRSAATTCGQRVHRQRQTGQHPHGPRDQPKVLAQFSRGRQIGDPPAGLNWDMWTGPAPESKYNENYHRGWNHFWRFSGGDIINDGVHQIDLARWLVGKTIRNRSTRPAADTPRRACSNRPTRKWPSTNSTTWS